MAADERAARSLRRDALANQEKVLAAALRMFLREGRHVPMAEIAAEAGVGVGTLYRRYPNRDALLEALTYRSFRILAELAEDAETRHGDAVARLDWWWDGVIDRRDQLVLPLHGGPPITSDHVRAEQARLHASLQRLLDLGRREGRIRDDVDIRDVILFGAMLITPLSGTREWDAIARRQKAVHIDGLTVRSPTRWRGASGSC